MPRPLSTPTPEFFEAAIPNVHRQLRLQLRCAAKQKRSSRPKGAVRRTACFSPGTSLSRLQSRNGAGEIRARSASSLAVTRPSQLPPSSPLRSRGRLRRPRKRAPTQEKASISSSSGSKFKAADFAHESHLTADRSSLTKFSNDFSDGYGIMSDDDDYENGPPVIFDWPDTAGSELGTLSLDCLSDWDSTTFPQVSLMYPESLTSETPRSVTTKSTYFVNRVRTLPSSQSNRLIVTANNRLGQQLRLLDPAPRGDHALQRPSTTTNASMRVRATEGNSRQRMQTSEDLRMLLSQVKQLRGVSDPSGSQASLPENKISALQRKQQIREQGLGKTLERQPGDMRGLSARVRVDMKVSKYRDPNQLHALRRGLGLVKDPAEKSRKKDEGGEDEHDTEKRQAGRATALVQTPRAMANDLLRRAQIRNERMHLATVRRKALIEKEIEHFYATSSAFREARELKAKNDRLSSRKVTRGWIKISWAYLSGVHFHRTLMKARANRAEAKAQYMAQVKISSQYRRRKGLREYRARQRADYILKSGLKRLARQFKQRRRRSSADMLLSWLRKTHAFSRRVLGYLHLRNAACAIQRTWRNFRAIKEHQIRALSYKMKSLAADAHQYAVRRHTQSGSRNKLPPMEPLPPWDIQYEILGDVVRPVRREWQDRVLPKYQLDRAVYIAKRSRYDRQREQEALERRGMSKRPGIDLGALLMEPHRPRFDAALEVNDKLLLQAWKEATHLAKFPKKWRKRKAAVQKWLAERKANHYYGKGRAPLIK
eukprot:g3753.t1